MDYLIFLSSISLFSFSMCFTPGPNNAACMSIGLERGFKAVVPFSLGCTVCAVFTQFLTGLGLAEIFERFPLVYQTLKILGLLYILWLAWKISGLGNSFKRPGRKFRDPGAQPAGGTTRPDVSQIADNPPSPAEKSAGSEAMAAADGKKLGFIQGVCLQLLNVKVWMTNVIVVSNFVGSGAGAATRLILVSLFIPCLGMLANFTWGLGGMVMRRFLTSAGMRRANYLFALFLVLSVLLLYV